MACVNSFENLYKNLQKNFSIEKEDGTYTVGAYLRKRANEKNVKENLPVQVKASSSLSTTLFNTVRYISEKLTVKNTPSSEKTMRAFPLRTSLAACLSAVLVCTLMFSYALMQSPTGSSAGSYVVENVEEADETVAYVQQNN